MPTNPDHHLRIGLNDFNCSGFPFSPDHIRRLKESTASDSFEIVSIIPVTDIVQPMTGARNEEKPREQTNRWILLLNGLGISEITQCAP
jgi:hypothetical protein